DSLRNTLLRPEEASVIHHEDERAEKRCPRPLAQARRWRAFEAHPDIQDQASREKPHSCQQEWRDLAHAHADREEGRSPDKIDDRERQQNLPRRWAGGLHFWVTKSFLDSQDALANQIWAMKNFYGRHKFRSSQFGFVSTGTVQHFFEKFSSRRVEARSASITLLAPST